MGKKIFIWASTVIVIIASIYLMGNLVGGGPVASPSEVSADDWKAGNLEASVVLLEYGDFQCPACASRHPMVKNLLAEFGDHMTYIYRHFPLSIHNFANISAAAAEAAGKQGQFFEMQDLLYTNQTTWVNSVVPEDMFVSYATDLGLNVSQFVQDMNSSDTAALVREDLKSANKANLPGTPTFFLNGEMIRPGSEGAFRTLIRNAIEAAS